MKCHFSKNEIVIMVLNDIVISNLIKRYEKMFNVIMISSDLMAPFRSGSPGSPGSPCLWTSIELCWGYDGHVTCQLRSPTSTTYMYTCVQCVYIYIYVCIYDMYLMYAWTPNFYAEPHGHIIPYRIGKVPAHADFGSFKQVTSRCGIPLLLKLSSPGKKTARRAAIWSFRFGESSVNL